MSSVGAFVLLAGAMVANYLVIGPKWLHNRAVFCMAVTGGSIALQGTWLDDWTGNLVKRVLAYGIDAVDDPTILIDLSDGPKPNPAEVPNQILGLVVFLLVVYSLFALLPDKIGKKIGKKVDIFNFPESKGGGLNVVVWAVAMSLALLCDVPSGSFGDLNSAYVDFLANLTLGAPKVVKAVIG
jgi:hypothetical protein